MIASTEICADVPPLEDMSTEVKFRSEQRSQFEVLLRAKNNKKSTTSANITIKTSSELLAIEQKKESIERIAADLDVNAGKTSTKSEFSGLKKGFLASKTSTKSVELRQNLSTKNKPVILAKIETLAPTKSGPGTNSLVFGQVQDAMKSKFEGSTKNWMTPDFLSRIETNTILARAFEDPSFQKAAMELAQNPHAAFEKYSRERPDLIMALREFSGLLGTQFEQMADKEGKKN
ncbi:hypothetical protein HK100_000039, partial [Physocladia obscura]